MLSLALIWTAAAGAALLGRAAARWNRRAALAVAAMLLLTLAWLGWTLAEPMTLLVLLTPGAASALGSVVVGLVVALVVTTHAARRAREEPR